jgi:cytoskeleton protein RodZ
VEEPTGTESGGRTERSRGADARTGSIGLYLAGQRRLRGISVEELAFRTRIPRRNIERLEAGAFDRAPDGFSRGFVRTIAEALGLDPDEAVMRLMSEPAADDLEGVRRRRIAVGLRVAALAGGLVLLVVLGRLLVVALSSGEVRDPAAEVLYRRDAVRSLAESPPTAPQAPPRKAADAAEPAGR